MADEIRNPALTLDLFTTAPGDDADDAGGVCDRLTDHITARHPTSCCYPHRPRPKGYNRPDDNNVGNTDPEAPLDSNLDLSDRGNDVIQPATEKTSAGLAGSRGLVRSMVEPHAEQRFRYHTMALARRNLRFPRRSPIVTLGRSAGSRRKSGRRHRPSLRRVRLRSRRGRQCRARSARSSPCSTRCGHPRH